MSSTSKPGRPGGFKKGNDPRRNMGGNKNAEAQSFARPWRLRVEKSATPWAVRARESPRAINRL